MIIEVSGKKIDFDLFDTAVLEPLKEFGDLTYDGLEASVREYFSRKFSGEAMHRAEPRRKSMVSLRPVTNRILENIDLKNRLDRLIGYGLVTVYGSIETHKNHYGITEDGMAYLDSIIPR